MPAAVLLTLAQGSPASAQRICEQGETESPASSGRWCSRVTCGWRSPAIWKTRMARLAASSRRRMRRSS